jgi:hypothetical protein
MTAEHSLFILSHALAPTSTLRAVLAYADLVGTPACDCALLHVDKPTMPEASLAWEMSSSILLCFESVKEVLRAQCTNDVQGIVQHFK